MRVVRLLVVGGLVAAAVALWVWWPSVAAVVAVEARLSSPVTAAAPTVESPPDVPALPPAAEPAPAPEMPAASEAADAAESEEAAAAELMAEPPMDMVKVLVRSTTGQPCLGAKVRFNRRGLVWPWTTTGVDGRCTIEAQRGAQGSVEVEHPYAAGRATVELATDARDSELIIPLKLESGALRIRLTRAPGSTAFTGVGLLSPHKAGSARTERKLRDAGWNLNGLTPGRWTLRVVPCYSPFLPVTRVIEVAPGVAGEIEIALSPGNTMAGVVVDTEGTPVSGVVLRASTVERDAPYDTKERPSRGMPSVYASARGLTSGTWMAKDGGSYATMRSGDDGRFTFAGFVDGDVQLYVVHQGEYLPPQAVDSNNQRVRIEVPSAPPAIRLVIVRPDGAKARSWDVMGRNGKHHRVLSGAAGPSFELGGMPAGECLVWARSRYPKPALSALAVVTVKDGVTTTVEVEPREAASVRCTPVAAEDGTPLTHIWFHYRWRGFKFGPSSSINWEMVAPPEEDLIVCARTVGRKVVEQPVRFAPGERKDLGEIRFLKK